MISYHGLYIGRALKEILQIFVPTHVSPKLLLNDVATLIKWSQKFKVHQQERRPFRQLEALFSNYKDPDAAFTQTAIGYLLEHYGSEKLKSILNNLVNTMFERSQVQVRIIRTMGNIASVFGLLGSLICIIMAISHSYIQSNELLNSIASSLVPMFYGFVLAYLIFKPAARKLEQKNEMRRFRNQLLSCGFVLLSENSSALELQDTLNSFLDPERHFHIVARH
jgi:chemotaxis protein MotA